MLFCVLWKQRLTRGPWETLLKVLASLLGGFWFSYQNAWQIAVNKWSNLNLKIFMSINLPIILLPESINNNCGRNFTTLGHRKIEQWLKNFAHFMFVSFVTSFIIESVNEWYAAQLTHLTQYFSPQNHYFIGHGTQ